MGDNDIIKLGDGADLQIYHDSSTGHSHITEVGTGSLIIKGTNIAFQNGAGTENLLAANTNGSVDLYYDAAKKLATTATGIDVTGEVQADSLDIDGNGTIDGTLTITTSDNNQQLIIKSTDADANDGPIFDLVRDSASPADNDIIGSIRWRGDDSAGNETQYADIRVFINDVTDGTEDGQFNLRTMLNGSLRLRIKADPTEMVFNEESQDLDFRVESDASTHGLFLDGGSGHVGIHATPTTTSSVYKGTQTGLGATLLGRSDDTPLYLSSNLTYTDNWKYIQNTTGSQIALGTNIQFFTVASGTAGNTATLEERMRIDSSGRVMIGTTTEGDGSADDLTIATTGNTGITIRSGTIHNGGIYFSDGTSGNDQYRGYIDYDHNGDNLNFATDAVERMRIDSSGNLLVGTTTVNPADNNDASGSQLSSIGSIQASVSNATPAIFNRGADGGIIGLLRAGVSVGTIAVASVGGAVAIGIGHSDSALYFDNVNNCVSPFDINTNNINDDWVSLGVSSARFDNVYATNGTIQTSDRNEKQDIEELSEAEQRVAVVAKGLMRKFRWKSAVAEKGDNARTHFGIIAQDLQDAFTAEGLDASKYAMFCSDTWWEKEISVDAVEADEENGIEAKDAYTYMDTKDEATEGYTEKTRLGVRYNQLLAFIISAI